MPKKESPLHSLSSFLPDGAYEGVAQYLQEYKVHLTVTRERKNILGNYRNKIFDKNHRISVNGNLNKYSFLITLLHELAHLLAHEPLAQIAHAGPQVEDDPASAHRHFHATRIPAKGKVVGTRACHGPPRAPKLDLECHLPRIP